MSGEDMRIGLALGGGGAAALSYIGVLEEFDAAGIRPYCVAGTSAGAVVGAAYATGRLAEFRQIMTSLTRGRVFTLFDPTWGRGGLFDGRRPMDMLAEIIKGDIEQMPMRYAAVATDLDTGQEVVLDHGSAREAVRASVAIPGVFCPRTVEGRVLVDGGLVNPIPVSVARGMDADFVIAVSILRLAGVLEGLAESALNAEELAPRREPIPSEECDHAPAGAMDIDAAVSTGHGLGLLDVLSKGSAVVQSHIAAARLRDTPPDAFLVPRSEHIGIFELMRCAEAVELGRDAARRALPALLDTIEKARRTHANPLRRMLATTLARRHAI